MPYLGAADDPARSSGRFDVRDLTASIHRFVRGAEAWRSLTEFIHQCYSDTPTPHVACCMPFDGS